MIRLFLFVFGVFFTAAGIWQFRHPERTQAIAMRGARYSWQRKLFGSDGYLISAQTNGFVFLVIGCAILLFIAIDLVIGVLL